MKKTRLCAAAIATITSGLIPNGAWAEAAPLRIGLPVPLSGPYSLLSTPIKRTVDFAVGQANAKGGVDGHKVEFKMLDTEAKADLARKQAEKLALDGYGVLTGTVTSGESLAIAPMLERWNAIYVSTFSKNIKLTGDSCSPRMFRVNQSDTQDMALIKPWLATRKETRWAIVNIDTAWGREIGQKFQEAVTSSGKKITSASYPPMGTNDFAPFIQQIKSDTSEAVFASTSGRDAVNFLTQSKQFGLLDGRAVGGVSIILESGVKAVGAAADGVMGNINYSASLDTPNNKEFVAAWRKMYNGDDPTDLEGEMYVGFQTIFQAVERAHSVAPVDIAKAISGGNFETVFGKVVVRAADNQMVLPNYFGQVIEQGGKRHNVITVTLSPDQATPPPDGSCKMGKL